VVVGSRGGGGSPVDVELLPERGVVGGVEGGQTVPPKASTTRRPATLAARTADSPFVTMRSEADTVCPRSPLRYRCTTCTCPGGSVRRSCWRWSDVGYSLPPLSTPLQMHHVHLPWWQRPAVVSSFSAPSVGFVDRSPIAALAVP